MKSCILKSLFKIHGEIVRAFDLRGEALEKWWGQDITELNSRKGTYQKIYYKKNFKKNHVQSTLRSVAKTLRKIEK